MKIAHVGLGSNTGVPVPMHASSLYSEGKGHIVLLMSVR